MDPINKNVAPHPLNPYNHILEGAGGGIAFGAPFSNANADEGGNMRTGNAEEGGVSLVLHKRLEEAVFRDGGDGGVYRVNWGRGGKSEGWEMRTRVTVVEVWGVGMGKR